MDFDMETGAYEPEPARKSKVRFVSSAAVAYRMAAMRLIFAKRDKLATDENEKGYPSGCRLCGPGRLWLCSQGSAEVEAAELRYTNKRPAIEQFQTLAEPKMKRCDIGVGANKGYRIPRPVSYLVDDRITWWAIGDAAQVRTLLELVTHVGKKRSVGWGRVVEWRVEGVDPWEGFPVLRDGLPLRPLPLYWPGLAPESPTAFRTLAPPYWDHSRESLVACPRHH